MRRPKIAAPVPDNSNAAALASMVAFLGTPADQASCKQKVQKAKKTRGNTTAAQRQQHLADIEARIARQDWSGTNATTLVALYWVCHVKVYGVPPLELDTSEAWRRATMLAGGLVKKQFEGDYHTAIKWMRWVWTREQRREEYRRNNPSGGTRIGWLWMFGRATLVTDWRAERIRKGA